MSWALERCSVVGSVCGLDGTAPFERDAVVLANADEPHARLILGGTRDGELGGERLEATEWDELLATGEALAITPPYPLRPGLEPMCWILRPSFPNRETARAQLQATPGSILHAQDHDDAWVLIVDEARVRALLDDWSRHGFDEAFRLAQAKQWDAAFVHADLAWLCDLSLSLDRVALLALITEHREGLSAAEDLIHFELNSRTPRPEVQLRALIGQYRLAVDPNDRSAPRTPPRLAPLAARMRELEAQGKIGNPGAWRRAWAAKARVLPSSP